jgi:hypothetical protein
MARHSSEICFRAGADATVTEVIGATTKLCDMSTSVCVTDDDDDTDSEVSLEDLKLQDVAHPTLRDAFGRVWTATVVLALHVTDGLGAAFASLT